GVVKQPVERHRARRGRPRAPEPRVVAAAPVAGHGSWPHAAPATLRHFTAVQRELRGHGPPGARGRPPWAVSSGWRGQAPPPGTTARRYKPAPEAYLTAIELLGLAPGEVMMV